MGTRLTELGWPLREHEPVCFGPAIRRILWHCKNIRKSFDPISNPCIEILWRCVGALLFTSQAVVPQQIRVDPLAHHGDLSSHRAEKHIHMRHTSVLFWLHMCFSYIYTSLYSLSSPSLSFYIIQFCICFWVWVEGWVHRFPRFLVVGSAVRSDLSIFCRNGAAMGSQNMNRRNKYVKNLIFVARTPLNDHD